MTDDSQTCDNKTFYYWINMLCYSNPKDLNYSNKPDAKVGSYVFGGICVTE